MQDEYVVFILEHSQNKRTFLDSSTSLKKSIDKENGLVKGGSNYTKKYMENGKWILKLSVEKLRKYQALNIIRKIGNKRKGSQKSNLDKRKDLLLNFLKEKESDFGSKIIIKIY